MFGDGADQKSAGAEDVDTLRLALEVRLAQLQRRREVSPGLQLGNIQSGIRELLSSLRSRHKKLRECFRTVDQFEVLDEVIFVEVRRQRLTLPRH